MIPKDSIFRPVVNLFTATFNSPSLGEYDFNTNANTNQSVLKINPENLYFISIMNVGATVPESAFLENINITPAIQFRMKRQDFPLYGGFYPIANYYKNNEIRAYYWTKQKNNELLATFKGLLNQNGSLIAYPTITVQIELNIFEITDRHFIDEFHKTGKATPGGTEMLGGGRTGKHNVATVPAEFDKRV